MPFTPRSQSRSQQFLAWSNAAHAPAHTILSLLCDRCVCELVPGWGSVSSWNIYSDREREVIARLQRRERSWYPRVENKYLWKIPLASEHFPTHAWNTHTHTHTGKEERENIQPVTLINIQSTVFHLAVWFTIIADGSRMLAALLLHADGTKRLLLWTKTQRGWSQSPPLKK